MSLSGTSSVLQSPKSGLKDMDVLCTFKIKIESQNSDHGCLKEQWKRTKKDQDPKPQSETSSILQTPNEDLKEMGVLCTFKIKIESLNLDHGFIKDKWPYPNQDQDEKPQSGTSSIIQSPPLPCSNVHSILESLNHYGVIVKFRGNLPQNQSLYIGEA